MPGKRAPKEDVHEGAAGAARSLHGAQVLHRLLQPPVRHLRT